MSHDEMLVLGLVLAALWVIAIASAMGGIYLVPRWLQQAPRSVDAAMSSQTKNLRSTPPRRVESTRLLPFPSNRSKVTREAIARTQRG